MSVTAYQLWQSSGSPLPYREWVAILPAGFNFPNELDGPRPPSEDRGGCSSEGCELDPRGVHRAMVASVSRPGPG